MEPNPLNGIIYAYLTLFVGAEQYSGTQLIIKRTCRDAELVDLLGGLPKTNSVIGIRALGIEQWRLVQGIVAHGEAVTFNAVVHEEPRIHTGAVFLINLGTGANFVVPEVFLIIQQQIPAKLSFIVVALRCKPQRGAHKEE